MNPHRLCWGPAFGFPFAQVVAITLLVAIVARSKSLFRPIWNAWTITWVIFIFLMLVSSMFALSPNYAIGLEKTLKVQLIVFLVMMTIRRREHILTLLWITFFSVGFYGVKSGIFTIQTAGNYRVYGPYGGFFADNNSLAVALLMSIPLAIYLAKITGNAWIRRGLYLSIFLIFVSVVGSQSRGALVAIVAVLGYMWLGSKKKVLMVVPLVFVIPLMFMFMPEKPTSHFILVQTIAQVYRR